MNQKIFNNSEPGPSEEVEKEPGTPSAEKSGGEEKGDSEAIPPKPIPEGKAAKGKAAEKADKKRVKRGSKGKKKRGKKEIKDSAENPEEKPKDPPLLRVDWPLRGMILAAKAEMEGATLIQTAKTVFKAWHNKAAQAPPMHCNRLDPSTLQTLMGIIAEREKFIKETIRAIIRAKIDPEKMSELTLQLEQELEDYTELRRTMQRIANIPITPDLPEAVGVGIAIMEQAKLDKPHNAAQYDTNIEILKSFRPIEYDLPDDLREKLKELRKKSNPPLTS